MTAETAPARQTTDTRAALLEPLEMSPLWLRQSLAALTQDFRPRIPDARALTASQRRFVEETSSRLASHLAPASPAESGKWCAVLQASLYTRDLEPELVDANAEGFLIALEDAPAFALQEAVRRILKARTGCSKKFVPAPPELRALVDEISLPARWHAVQLRRLLEAEVEREPERPSVDRASQIAAAAIAALPAVTRRRPGNPAGVNHADKGGW